MKGCIVNILDIAPGTNWTVWAEDKRHIEFGPHRVICVDKRFLNDQTLRSKSERYKPILAVSCDIFEYLDQNIDMKFQRIYSDRFFEHLDTEQIFYLLYLLYERTTPDAIMRIVVPDAGKVFEEYTSLNSVVMPAVEFTKKYIWSTKEIFNEPTDPHKTLWTPVMARYWLELEGYWKIKYIRTPIELDGRNWYMEIAAQRR